MAAPDRVCNLADALADVDEQVDDPFAVWWWDDDAGAERRGVLYGWRHGEQGGRDALILLRGWWDRSCPTAGGCVLWVPDHWTRPRNE